MHADEKNHATFFFMLEMFILLIITYKFESPHDKTNKMICAPSENPDQPGHPPSLIRVFTVHSMGS